MLVVWHIAAFIKANCNGLGHFWPPNFYAKPHNLLDKKALQWYMEPGFEGGANGLPNSFSAINTQDDSCKSHQEGINARLSHAPRSEWRT
jgi:hypothetical protein